MGREVRDVLRRFGLRLQALRNERNWTQEKLAAACGVSQKYLSELERGVKAPSFETIVALAHRGFGVRLAGLLFGVDDVVRAEVRQLEDLLAGRPEKARRRILTAVLMLLEAGAGGEGEG